MSTGEPTWWLATQQNLPAKLDTECLRLTDRITALEAQVAAADDLLDAVEAWKNTCIETEDVGAAIAQVELKRAAYRAAKGE